MKIRNPEYITITIPAYKEDKILRTLKSILACDNSGVLLQVRILINESESEDPSVTKCNQQAFNELKDFISMNALSNKVLVKYEVFNAKHAGVGLARKTVMDETADDYRKNGINGVIAALDADCIVEKNYLQAIKDYFSDTKYEAASLYFEHPLQNTTKYHPIIEYEFHLRYFILMQRSIGLPFSIHTVGSSMACLSDTYIAKGGMNKRKAGEDFYFMHKFIKDGVCGIMTDTTVYPDGRVSDRVPFGTGRAVGKYIEKDYNATTYNPTAFSVFLEFIQQVENLFLNPLNKDSLDPILVHFLQKIHFENRLQDIKRNTSTTEAFKKRFYQFFDAFQLMKCLHFMREKYEDIPVAEAADFVNIRLFESSCKDIFEVLMKLRKIDAGKLDVNLKALV